jgi:hypothetical protein
MEMQFLQMGKRYTVTRPSSLLGKEFVGFSNNMYCPKAKPFCCCGDKAFEVSFGLMEAPRVECLAMS